MKAAFLLISMITVATAMLNAQSLIHEKSDSYMPPTEPEVIEKLAQWQDLKFGVLMHWGVYSVPGICESWTITSEDWITPDPVMSYEEYKQWYWGLSKDFNPTKFNPEQWARVMKKAGMKYMVFTSKHHDGFCLWDTKTTDYKVTNSGFAGNERQDVLRYVFDAFRNEGFWTGCYFSKPDWHSEYYWWPKRGTSSRFHNYPISQYPERWENYKSYVHSQIGELMNDYGHFDILWLDGGWCTAPQEDIDMDRLVTIARDAQPGLIVVDRTCAGKYENYQTPEQTIPAHQLTNPWETCMTLTNDWGWVPRPTFKSPARVIAMLAEVVAKGGSLLLGVGPTPEGLIEDEAVARLEEVGEWLAKNGEAIYNTVATPVYTNKDRSVWFTASKDGKTLYAIIPQKDDDSKETLTISWQGNSPRKGSRIIDLATKKAVRYVTRDGVTTVTLPKGAARSNGIALRFSLEQPMVYKDASASVEDRVFDLLGRMTVKEKVGQLLCPLGWFMYEKTGDNSVELSDLFVKRMDDMPLGGCWGVLRADPWTQKTLVNGLNPRLGAEAFNKMQRYAVEHTRLGIPMIFAEEASHGHMAIGTTTFPTGIGQASTFDSEILQRMGQAIALELRSQGGLVGYGPVLDIARDPRWGRMEETFGEDPVLAGVLGSAIVKGMQGDDIADGRHVCSTLKHFAAYGVSEGGLNGESNSMGKRTLLSEYIPQFKSAVEAGAGSVMTSYNSIDGIPCTCNSYLLTNVLRNQWGFDGVVYSDLVSIEGIANNHNVAKDYSEAAALALKAGVDIDLQGDAFGANLEKNIADGRLSMKDLDRAVANVLRLKFRMGLFENPYVDPEKTARIVHSDEHIQLAREVAQKSIVLLKNTGLLPLSKDVRSIAVIGPNADMPYNQLGDYTAPQAEGKVRTVLDGIRDAVPSARIEYVKGCAIRDTQKSDIARAAKVASECDVTILVLGGSSARDFKTNYSETGAASGTGNLLSDMETGEGMDRASLTLMGDQEKLLKAVLDATDRAIVVYVEGRPLDMSYASEHAQALLNAWYPGEQGGNAIADVIFGDVNPAGRLAVSVPRSVGQIPCYYSRRPAHDYTDLPQSPLYAFGYGLSYTTFGYSDLKITEGDGKDIYRKVSCKVTNTGKKDGEEVVQLYINDVKSSVETPHKLLKAFRRIPIKAGESVEVSFDLGFEELSILDIDLNQKVEPGTFNVMVGAASDDIRLEGSFELLQ